MKKAICLTLLLGLVSFAFAKRMQDKPALQAMVDTERAFAKMSEDQGTRPAFVAFIADDGILFRPRAVKGKQWFAEHPAPQSDKRPLLSWYPAVAGMARAGDLGYTTGPWEFKPDIHDDKSVAWGHFLTVWKRQPDGSWKFAIDLGISNPQPAQVEAPWVLPQGYKTPKPMKGSLISSNTALLARDREFSQAATKRGARAAFADYAMPGLNGLALLRQVRNDWPAVGRILMTSRMDLDFIADAKAEGVIEALVGKPWDALEMRDQALRLFRARLTA